MNLEHNINKNTWNWKLFEKTHLWNKSLDLEPLRQHEKKKSPSQRASSQVTEVFRKFFSFMQKFLESNAMCFY